MRAAVIPGPVLISRITSTFNRECNQAASRSAEGLPRSASTATDLILAGYWSSAAASRARHGVNRVHVGDLAKTTEDAFRAWVLDRSVGLDAIMIAPTRELVAELNRRARDHRLDHSPAVFVRPASHNACDPHDQAPTSGSVPEVGGLDRPASYVATAFLNADTDFRCSPRNVSDPPMAKWLVDANSG